MNRVYFATSADHPALTPDDRLAADALRGLGFTVVPAVWSATEPESLRDAGAVVIRSCWDYHVRPAEFADWIRALEHHGVMVLNPPGLVLWNLHKRYLLELEARGVAIVPTVLVPQGDDGRNAADLAAVLDRAGWSEAVVKPAVSLSAHETWRTSVREAAADAPRLRAMLRRGDVLVQAFVPEITDGGEWSMVFLGGAYSHAVRKRPAPGDFRVQIEHGGSADPAEPAAALVADARRALEALPAPPAYARVDGVDVAGRLVLMEMECIDPVLFLAGHPGSAARFAEVIAAAVGAGIVAREG